MNPLLVPIELDILLANPALVARDNFRWWRYTYVNLSDNTFQSPEPLGFDASYNTATTGAYLHWTLPRSLRSSGQDSSSNFPYVPNRWLIVRMAKDSNGNNILKSWVLESDCPNPDGSVSSYFMVDDSVVAAWKASTEPNRQAAQPVAISSTEDTGANTVNIGMAFDATTWTEQAAGNSFLTAVAPGNMEFSGYMPFNQNVFSFYDDLTDAPADTVLSYFVSGWYADETADIVATTNGFTGADNMPDVLTALNWTVAQNADPSAANASVYTGMALGLTWSSTATSAPSPDQLEDSMAAANMTVAVANTDVDAFSTLIGQQLSNVPGYTNTSAVIALLQAFQYDLLPLLNQTNGDTLLAEKVQQQWFSSKLGGTRWVITPPENNSGNATINPTDAAWLLQLNLNQQALDKAIAELYSLQWTLNGVWWKSGYMNALAQQMAPNNTGIQASDLSTFLDPTNASGSLGLVLSQLQLIDGLLSKVPQPIYTAGVNDQDAYLNGIAAFAQQQGITAGYTLKAASLPRYWQTRNPVVLISGIEPDDSTDPDSSLEIRLSTQVINSLTVDNITVTPAMLSNVLPALTNAAAYPAIVSQLYTEFFLLDPSNSALIASAGSMNVDDVTTALLAHNPAAYNPGVLPALSLEPWTQQWNPMYLEWEVTYTAIPFEYIEDPTSGTVTRNWTFDGTDYQLKSTVSGAAAAESITGRSLLSPHTQLTFGARLEAFLAQYGSTNTNLQDLYNEIEQVDKWLFLSQELVNFNEYLTQRDPRTFRRPTVETFTNGSDVVSFAKVIGYPDSDSTPPYDTPSNVQGLVNSIPAVKLSGPSDFPFQAIRSGQAYLSHLVVYDQFGRKLDLIDPMSSGTHDANNFPLVVDAALTVTNNLTPAVAAPFQLPPRLLQPGRLDMLLVDQVDNTKVLDYAADVNPVGGWVISNHLDQSLQLFLQDGTNAGEIQLLVDTANNTLTQWVPPPHNNLTIASITTAAPPLGAFISAAINRPATDFQALIAVIDTTLWTTDPLGSRTDINLSVLVGRPLALVQTQLQFSLDGPPIAGCDWPTPVSAAPVSSNIPDFTTSNFSIRLGDLASQEDGVIGYFTQNDFSVFNSVALPPDGQTYVQQIGPLAGADGNFINLPFDGSTTAMVTLLLDPRAAAHAVTGILPVTTLVLPEVFVDTALAAMEITFKVGPLLTITQAASTSGGVTPVYADNINYLPIIEKNGSWSWWESTVTNPGTAQASFTWQGYGLNNATVTALLNYSQAELHEGVLQFITQMNTDTSSS
ncbi:hypothetical protein SAMN05444266_109354 [Chitinophaga jiangningensis]|uniref:Uncharacterized protein n=1 Tax=Chitinophaga jiangningensis TaxID=1419482 RepID=A0A1M7KIX8_9BACT|nr:hypothetical protein [Chitinophaga jiangningensis]SHM65294.1 hypothetical protein SAMN05444266_109354 [Chitinophaga jiangningensis]